MSNIRFWGQTGFEMYNFETHHHHSAFLNPKPNGLIEFFIVTSKKVDLGVSIQGEGMYKIVSKNIESSDEDMSLPDGLKEVLSLPDDIEADMGSFETCVLFKPKGIGNITFKIDDQELPLVEWSFVGGDENIVFCFEGRPLILRHNMEWFEPLDKKYKEQEKVIGLLKEFQNAETEEQIEKLKQKVLADNDPSCAIILHLIDAHYSDDSLDDDSSNDDVGH